ncbi:MAG: phosphoenolpyruvate--protein phosphotransferase [Opitutales bacterium]
MASQSAENERVLRGIPASPGVAHGHAFVFLQTEIDIPAYPVDPENWKLEIQRFDNALVQTRQEIKKLRQEVAGKLGEAEAQIFDAHLLVLEDKALIDEVIKEQEETGFNIEHCFHTVSQRYIDFFDSIDDEYMKERMADIRDVTRRLLRNLLGRAGADLRGSANDRILVAEDFSPSDAAILDGKKVLGLLADTGGRTSHAVIMARSLEVPAVVGLNNATEQIAPGDLLLVDGYEGVVIIRPTEQTLYRYGKIETQRRNIREMLTREAKEPAYTADGREFILRANIDSPADIEPSLRYGARGIGLFRTENLFLRDKYFPDEDQQFAHYREVAEGIAPRAVTIRTLDLGGDKNVAGLASQAEEENPFMGFRAIRFCLQHTDVFKAQIRAILRATRHGKVKMMYPMVSGLDELLAANRIVGEAMADLSTRGEPYDPEISVGTMIEVPSAAYTADLLARECSFFSIGTNDLIQYLFAADRLNERIAHLYQPSHPAVVRTLKAVIDAGHRHKIPVGICGEMAGDPLYTGLLVGLGADELSITPSLLPEVKYLLRRISFKDAQKLARRVLELGNTDTIREQLDTFYQERMGSLMTPPES